VCVCVCVCTLSLSLSLSVCVCVCVCVCYEVTFDDIRLFNNQGRYRPLREDVPHANTRFCAFDSSLRASSSSSRAFSRRRTPFRAVIANFSPKPSKKKIRMYVCWLYARTHTQTHTHTHRHTHTQPWRTFDVAMDAHPASEDTVTMRMIAAATVATIRVCFIFSFDYPSHMKTRTTIRTVADTMQAWHGQRYEKATRTTPDGSNQHCIVSGTSFTRRECSYRVSSGFKTGTVCLWELTEASRIFCDVVGVSMPLWYGVSLAPRLLIEAFTA